MLWAVYYGQISEGVAHGFGKIMYAYYGKCYLGFFKNNVKWGFGIQFSSDGKQISGIWQGDEFVAKFVPISQFDQNYGGP